MMHTSLKVSTIIVSYNTAELTSRAIDSVLKEYKHSNISGEIIVVDNNSTDNSVSLLKKQFGRTISLIEQQKNLGFAAGNNIGIRKSTGQFVLLLNSDAQLLPGAISALLKVFKTHPDNANTQLLANTHQADQVGIVSGKLLNTDHSLQFQGGALPSITNIFLWWALPFPGSWIPIGLSYHIEDARFYEQEQLIGWVGGTAMMIKREVIDMIGELDEEIFMYAEDVEYCMRARKHHWDVIYTPDAEILHHGSASSSTDNSLKGEIHGLLFVFQKHFQVWKYHLLRAILLFGTLQRVLLFDIILGHAKSKKIYSEIFTEVKKRS